MNFDTYDLAKVNASLANTRVQAGIMPPASSGLTLTAAQKALFQDWINLDIPSGREVTYPALTDSLLTGKCITCHDSKKSGTARLGAPTTVNFDTYTAAKASFATGNNYVQAGNHPFSSVGITAGQKLLFFDWIYAGMPQGETGPVCDLDGNGTAGVSDVIWLLLYMRDHAFDQSHDYNGDGRFSISDAVMLVLHLRNGVCRESSGMLAAAGPLAAVSRIEGLTQAQIDYLENTFDQLGLTPDEEAAFWIDLYGNSGRPELPRAYSLSQNSPNPFNPATTISYTVPDGQRARVTIGIFDLGGRLIRTLVDTDREAGIYTVFWNGLDERGEPAASGVYFYRMTAGDYSQTRKMVLVK
ncbi:MAG: FlgD immunoglobulin-like domain containing protein [Candidatus Glassbacteria bacterium]